MSNSSNIRMIAISGSNPSTSGSGKEKTPKLKEKDKAKGDKSKEKEKDKLREEKGTSKHLYYKGWWYENWDDKTGKPGIEGQVWVQYNKQKNNARIYFSVTEGQFKGTQLEFEMKVSSDANGVPTLGMPDLSGTVLKMAQVAFTKDPIAQDKPETESSGTFTATSPFKNSKGRWAVHATSSDRTPDPKKWKDNYSLVTCALM